MTVPRRNNQHNYKIEYFLLRYNNPEFKIHPETYEDSQWAWVDSYKELYSHWILRLISNESLHFISGCN